MCALVASPTNKCNPTAGTPPLYCRYDAGNASLSADLEELRAAMLPALDAPALRQRGNARFQAQDYDGAVEAFTLLLGMPDELAPGRRLGAEQSSGGRVFSESAWEGVPVNQCSMYICMGLAVRSAARVCVLRWRGVCLSVMRVLARIWQSASATRRGDARHVCT